jgi:lysophospholipase L1-like esterase
VARASACRAGTHAGAWCENRAEPRLGGSAETAPKRACATAWGAAPSGRIEGEVYFLTASLTRGCLLLAAALAWAQDRPSYFSVHVAEGNYRVTVTLEGGAAGAVTTVKAELARLMLENVRVAPGESVTRSFIVNVRTPAIAGGGEVRLKDREKTTEAAAWDDQLTLEFIGPRAALGVVDVAPAGGVPTLYLAGDSTVTDQPREPYNSWGQMLPRFFKPEIAVANHAESGESLRSFIGERRLDKILGLIRPGDFLLVQMGHNDQKEKGEGVGAFTTYKASLKRFVAEARARGARPILATSMHRRTFDAQGKITNSLGDYPEAVRQVAREDGVPLIDLHAMSQTLYEAWGPEASVNAFAPGDGTHHNRYGSYELAKCVVEAIRRQKLELARYIVDDFAGFDPAHPDPMETFGK